jgi:hypothetical protein
LGLLPKNLIIRFGAHRASIYSNTSAATTAALIAAAKDHIRDSRARELASRTVRPKIIDEVFPDYQKLLDNVEVEPTPLTLPRLLTLGPVPTSSGQKRAGNGLDPDDTGDTGASGNGTNPTRG